MEKQKIVERFKELYPNLDQEVVLYLEAVLQMPTLTKEQTRKLSQTLRDNVDAKEILIKANLHLVLQSILYHKPEQEHLWDFIQAGNHGLVFAIDRYDFTKEMRSLEQYVTKTVHYFMDKEKNVLDDKIGVSAFQFRKIKKFAEDLAILRQKHGSSLTIEDIAQKLNVPYKEVYAFFGALSDLLSFDDEENNDLVDDRMEDVLYKGIDRKDLSEALWEELGRLERIERGMLIEYYGLESGIPKKQIDIAPKYGVSNATISATNKKTLQKMRTNCGYLRQYL